VPRAAAALLQFLVLNLSALTQTADVLRSVKFPEPRSSSTCTRSIPAHTWSTSTRRKWPFIGGRCLRPGCAFGC
jgi:hypothetical protein